MTGSVLVTGSAPVLRASGITRSFATPAGTIQVLHGIDLDVHAGTLVAICGPSGSGKSTLLHILGLLDRPTAGSLWVADQETTALGDRERTTLRAEHIGFVFQAYHLIPHKNAVQNVELSLAAAGWERSRRRPAAVDCLTALGLGDRLAARPDTLSGGEQQRVAIARAVVRRPTVLLCDEPTGNLDSANSLRTTQHLARLAHEEGVAVVIVTHDPRVADAADHTVTVSDGRVLDHAVPQDQTW